MKNQWSEIQGVRALVFDLGGTVISLDHPRIQQILMDAGVDLKDDWVHRSESAARKAVDELVRAGAEPSQVWDGFLTSYLNAAEADLSLHEQIASELREFHRRHHLWNRPVPGAPEALTTLSRSGYRLACISNSDGRAEALLQTLGLAREFEFVIDSHDVGVEKPDPRIFRMAADRLDLYPEDCAYIGDILTIDVEGSLRAGMRAVLMDHYGSYSLEELPDSVPRAVEASEILAGLSAAPAGEPGEEE